MGYRVAVVGATGNVGREILNVLAERQFPLDEVAAVASSRSTGDEVDFGDSGETLKVKNLEHFDFADWDIALFAAGSEVSRLYAAKAAQAGCTVIDNSSLYRMDPDVPLIVPEVNPEAIAGYTRKNIEFENEISADEARSILREAPGVMVVDKREDGGYVTPVEAVGDYATYVSRIREDPTVDNGLSLWVVSDNLRKGAALNAVQIAELLGRKHLQKAA